MAVPGTSSVVIDNSLVRVSLEVGSTALIAITADASCLIFQWGKRRRLFGREGSQMSVSVTGQKAWGFPCFPHISVPSCLTQRKGGI